MPNSIRTTSKTNISTSKTDSLATFKAGDDVVCPKLGNSIHKLFDDKEYGCLAFTTNGETYRYRDDGKVSRDDLFPEIFHNTSLTFIPAASQTTFDIGDVVLCPSLSSYPFLLTADPYGKRNVLALEFDGSYFYYDAKGFFVSGNDDETGDFQPSLYHNTPSNQLAIDALYGNTPTIPSSQRKVIDATESDDNEVVLMSPCMLSDTACDVFGAAEVMHDIGQLLNLIYREDISSNQVKSMARLAIDTTDRWNSILNYRLDTLNKPLEQTGFGKVEG